MPEVNFQKYELSLQILGAKSVENLNKEIDMEKEDLLESYSDFLEDISGDDDKSDEDWTPDNLFKEEKLSQGIVNILTYKSC